MPVSSPSYFVSQRSNGSIVGVTAGPATGAKCFLAGQNAARATGHDNLIVIGDNAFAAGSGGTSGDTVSGTIVIGALAMQSWLGQTEAGNFPNTVIGDQAANTLTDGAGNTILGSQILTLQALIADNNVLIGGNVAQGIASPVANRFEENVLVGHRALENATQATGTIITGDTIVGNDNFLLPSANRNIIDCVVVGRQTVQTNDTDLSDNIAIGNFHTLGASSAIVIGRALTLATTDGSSIFIGRNKVGTATGALFALGGATHPLLSGEITNGNVAIGGADGDFGGANATNVLKIMDGTKGNANPTGGGYFYSTAGVLHYVQTDGVDNVLQVGAGGVLLTSSVTLTNGAAAQTATLTNAPAAGNPTKWISINDNGTTRRIPAW